MDNAVQAPYRLRGCTLSHEAKVDRCALAGYCPTCGFSGEEMERRRAMIRAGGVQYDDKAATDVIMHWTGGKLGDDTLAILSSRPLRRLIIRRDDNDTV